jgi:DNA-binding LacI/PurR family transcriptional regulator
LRKALRSLTEEGLLAPYKTSYKITTPQRLGGSSAILCIGPGETLDRISIVNQRHHEFLHALYLLGRHHNISFVHKACPFKSAEALLRYIRKDGGRAIGILVWSTGIELSNRDRILETCMRIGIPIAVLDEMGDYSPPQQLRSRGLLMTFEPASNLAGAETGRLLLHLGHTRAAFVSPVHDACWSRRRFEGIADAFAQAGFGDGVIPLTIGTPDGAVPRNMAADPAKRERLHHLKRAQREIDAIPSDAVENIVFSDLRSSLASMLTYENERRWYAPLLDRIVADRSITALVGAYDMIGLYALGYFPRFGITVPREVSIAAFDDSFSCNRFGLTSYNFLFSDIARRMVHFILHPAEPCFRDLDRIECEGIIMERRSVGSAVLFNRNGGSVTLPRPHSYQYRMDASPAARG